MSEVYENKPIQKETELITILQYSDGEFSFFDGELEVKMLEIKTSMQKYLQSGVYSPDDCIERINAEQRPNTLATIKNNLDLINRAVNEVEMVVPLQKGERIFCFCSTEEYNSLYGDASLIENGYLATNKRLIFLRGEEIVIVPFTEIDSLAVNPLSWKWCLNGLDKFNLYRKNQDAEEFALVLGLIFLLVKAGGEESMKPMETQSNSSEARQNQMTKIPNETIEPAPSLTDRLREAKVLYDEGLITEAEYAGLKEKVLEKYV